MIVFCILVTILTVRVSRVIFWFVPLIDDGLDLKVRLLSDCWLSLFVFCLIRVALSLRCFLYCLFHHFGILFSIIVMPFLDLLEDSFETN